MVLFKQKTAYEMRISDWSSDVCSSDLVAVDHDPRALHRLDGRDDRAVDHFIAARPALERQAEFQQFLQAQRDLGLLDRKRVVMGKSVSVRVGLGWRRLIYKNTNSTRNITIAPAY